MCKTKQISYAKDEGEGRYKDVGKLQEGAEDITGEQEMEGGKRECSCCTGSSHCFILKVSRKQETGIVYAVQSNSPHSSLLGCGLKAYMAIFA